MTTATPAQIAILRYVSQFPGRFPPGRGMAKAFSKAADKGLVTWDNRITELGQRVLANDA